MFCIREFGDGAKEGGGRAFKRGGWDVERKGLTGATEGASCLDALAEKLSNVDGCDWVTCRLDEAVVFGGVSRDCAMQASCRQVRAC